MQPANVSSSTPERDDDLATILLQEPERFTFLWQVRKTGSVPAATLRSNSLTEGSLASI